VRIAIALIVASAGCVAGPGYWVRAGDVGLEATPAVRDGDGKQVMLQGDTYRSTGQARSDSLLLVRRAGAHGERFRAGAILLGVGVAMGVAGSIMISRGLGSCTVACSDSAAGNYELLLWGLLLTVTGGGSISVGLGLMISGAMQRPVEVATP
jgi:hypothetical protein